MLAFAFKVSQILSQTTTRWFYCLNDIIAIIGQKCPHILFSFFFFYFIFFYFVIFSLKKIYNKSKQRKIEKNLNKIHEKIKQKIK